MSNPTLAPGAAAPPAQVYTTFIRATPDRVWRAITESEFTLRYYYASSVESDFRTGSPYVYRIGDELAIVGTVLESDPPRRLVMSFHAVWDEDVAGDPPTRIAWEIEDAGGGVAKVTVVHDGFAAEDETFRQVAGGWSYILSGLKTLLETGRPMSSGA